MLHAAAAPADHRVVILDQDDPAEAVLVVGHLITNGELLNGRVHGHGIEGTSGQGTPGRGRAGFINSDE
jgi:fructose-specific component phosphotransferase system IIB-like protein